MTVSTFRLDSVLDTDPAVSTRDLWRCVQQGTSDRIHDLEVDCTGSHVVLMGRCRTWHIKQLATQAVLSAEPDVSLQNEIVVV